MKPFKFYDIEQNTEEWFELRGGLLNGSKLGIIMANYGKAFGEPAKRYAVDIAVEQITGKATKATYKNAAMDLGHEMEPLATAEYERQYFCDVSNGGFFKSDFIGCSPDGLLYIDGVTEVKFADSNAIHFNRIKNDSIDSTTYMWQGVGNLKFTGRDYLDFISYCPAFPDERILWVKRIIASELKEQFDMIDKRVAEFKKLVAENKNIILKVAS